MTNQGCRDGIWQILKSSPDQDICSLRRSCNSWGAQKRELTTVRVLFITWLNHVCCFAGESQGKSQGRRTGSRKGVAREVAREEVVVTIQVLLVVTLMYSMLFHLYCIGPAMRHCARFVRASSDCGNLLPDFSGHRCTRTISISSPTHDLTLLISTFPQSRPCEHPSLR